MDNIYSTLRVSRSEAIKKLKNAPWDLMSNEQLSNILDALLFHAYYNFVVTFEDEDAAYFEGIPFKLPDYELRKQKIRGEK